MLIGWCADAIGAPMKAYVACSRPLSDPTYYGVTLAVSGNTFLAVALRLDRDSRECVHACAAPVPECAGAGVVTVQARVEHSTDSTYVLFLFRFYIYSTHLTQLTG